MAPEALLGCDGGDVMCHPDGIFLHAAPPAKFSITAQPAPTRPAVDVSAEPAVDGAQEQEQPQQPKKEKKAPKAAAPNAVPAASGEGLFNRAQLQVYAFQTGVNHAHAHALHEQFIV